jgi:hypothetical protein
VHGASRQIGAEKGGLFIDGRALHDPVSPLGDLQDATVLDSGLKLLLQVLHHFLAPRFPAGNYKRFLACRLRAVAGRNRGLTDATIPAAASVIGAPAAARYGTGW